MKCPRCDGNGYHDNNPGDCALCNGTGKVCPPDCAGITKEQAGNWLSVLEVAENLYPQEFDRSGISDVIEEMQKLLEGRVE